MGRSPMPDSRSSGDNYLLSPSPTEPAATVRTSDNQLFCCKSIDKLIAESEAPGQRLQKTLGPWSLTALGIGAIIGSGIFVLTGTAAAGEYFQAPPSARASSRYHRELSAHRRHFRRPYARTSAGRPLHRHLVFPGRHGLQLRRTVLCRTGLDDSHRRQRLHLLLRDARRNLRLDHRLGPHPRIRRQQRGRRHRLRAYTKAQLGLLRRTLARSMVDARLGNRALDRLLLQLPAFLIIFILTVLLVRGVRESAEANNIMVAIKIGAILVFLVVGGALVNPSNWHPFAPSGFGGVVTGGAIVFFTYIGFDSVSTAAEEARNPQRDLPIGIIASLIVCTVLYVGVSIVLLGHDEVHDLRLGRSRRSPGRLRPEGARRQPLVAFHHRHRRAHRHDLVAAGLSVRPGAHLVRHVARRAFSQALLQEFIPSSRRPHWSTWIAGFAVGIPAGIFAIGDAADLSNIGTLFAFALVSLGVIILRRTQPDRPRIFKVPLVPWFPSDLDHPLRRPHDRTHRHHLAPLRRLAGLGLLIYYLLQPPPQRVREEVAASQLRPSAISKHRALTLGKTR